MVKGKPAHGTWKVGRAIYCGSFFGLGYFIWSSKMGTSTIFLSFSFVILVQFMSMSSPKSLVWLFWLDTPCHPKLKNGSDILLLGALPPHTICTMMVGLCPCIPLLLLGGSNCPPFILNITYELKRLGHVQIVGFVSMKVAMAIPSYDSPMEGSFTTFEFLPLDICLSFSSLLKACPFSYLKFNSTTSTSKATIDGIPMVVIVVCCLVKCKLWATLWNLPCNPPWLPFNAYVVSPSIFSFWIFLVLVHFCFAIVYATCPLE